MNDPADVEGAGDIAIIGMSGRFPGAANLEEFWQNLVAGVDSICRFTDDELLAAGVESSALADPAYVKAGGALPDVDLFDAAFFGINPRDAEALDPQQRLFLEGAWECLEHAGYNPAACPGLVGVYAGAAMSSYLAYLYGAPDFVRNIGEYQIALGNDKDSIPTFVSYKLNLKGPSMAVQAACSTSLVGVAVACQSLLSYQCDMALAGGVRIVLPQVAGYYFQEGGILSPDGRCRSFDARAAGTVGGNGVGLVALKRLHDAVEDRDCIHAVIKGTAINNDGAWKVGYTAPSVDGQAQVIAMALAAGGVEPRTVSYVEAHGTATALGDPIEVAALNQAFRLGTEDTGFCALGSVKSNVGHLDTAAGVAGLIKTVLALEHETLPPSLHFEHPNPEIDFASSPFYVNDRLSPWPADGHPRRAGVSSFGIGGTNVHVVLEQAPALEHHPSHRRAHIVPLSAKSAAAVDAMSERLQQHCARHPELDLADVAFTLQAGRSAFPFRRALVCRDLADAVNALARERDPERLSRCPEVPPTLAFLFAGQGTQHVGMAAGLYQHEPTFRDGVDRCAEQLRPHLGLDLREVIYPPESRADEASRQLDQTALAQPALFAIEYALACLWQEWGVRPQAMIGHSIGEYVAACLAGVFTLDDALALVAARGRLMQELPGGAMLAVALPEAKLAPFLEDGVSLAAINAPSSCVASGSGPAIDVLEAQLRRHGVAHQRLRTSHAFHSAEMEPILDRFRDLVGSVPRSAPVVPFVSNVTGGWITDHEATDADYWTRHLRQTVRFSAGLECLRAGHSTLLEIGPGQTLCRLARQHPGGAAATTVLPSLPGAPADSMDDVFLLGTVSQLWSAGTNIDWEAFHRHAPRSRTALPTYPFERQRYWVDPDRVDDHPELGTDTPAPLRTPDLADWFSFLSWRRSAPCAASAPPPSRGHRWLVFADPCGVGEALSRAAIAAGMETVLVRAGSSFENPANLGYTVRPDHAPDLALLLGDLRVRGWVPDTIVHSWGVTPGAGATDRRDELATCMALGFNSLVALAQTLGDLGYDQPVRLVVVSNQVHDLTGDEPLCASKATTLGACRVIPEEYSGVSCRHVDVEWPAADEARNEATIESLLAEICTESSDASVALRGRHRWVQVVEPIRLERRDDLALRDQGVYLITGGMGGIGFTLAEHLARANRARLVLVGRRSFPARAEWDLLLAQRPDDDATKMRIRVLRDLEEAGAEIVLETGDVADAGEMQAIVDRTLARFGSIHGVVHCAGVAGGRMIQFHTPDETERVMRPKVIGALVLDDVLQGIDLDFFVLCSSLTAIEGGIGQLDYCAANLFLDAFATQLRARQGRPATAVNWDTWQQVGMAVDTAVPRDMEHMRNESLERGIRPAEGAEAFTRLVGRGLAQVAVSTIELGVLGTHQTDTSMDTDAGAGVAGADVRPRPADVRPQPADVQPVHARPMLANEYLAPRDDIESEIAQVWTELLGVGPIGVTDDFFALGGHSLLALQVVSRLRDALQVDMRVRKVFDTPTVAGLAEAIRQGRDGATATADELARMLELVEGLSEDELQHRLSAGAGQSASEDLG